MNVDFLNELVVIKSKKGKEFKLNNVVLKDNLDFLIENFYKKYILLEGFRLEDFKTELKEVEKKLGDYYLNLKELEGKSLDFLKTYKHIAFNKIPLLLDIIIKNKMNKIKTGLSIFEVLHNSFN